MSLYLPKILDHVRYRFHTDGLRPENTSRITVHVDVLNSHYRGAPLEILDRRHYRKIENLFILAYPKHRVTVKFDGN